MSDAASRVQLASLRRDVVIAVRQTAQGVVVEVKGEAVEVTTRGAVACESMRIRAAKDAVVVIGGNLLERTSSTLREAGHDAILKARAVTLEATDGDTLVAANDDVDVKGDRIHLNPPEEPPR